MSAEHYSTSRKFYNIARGIITPEFIVTHKKEHLSAKLNEQDIVLKRQILKDWHNRFSPSFVLSQCPPTLSAEEQTGIIYFNAFIDWSDDILDKQKIEGNGLETQLLQSPLPIPNSPLTMADLRARMLKLFPPQKSKALERYFKRMIHLHEGLEKPKAGDYSFSDATRYHQQTSLPYLLMGSYLADVADPIRQINHIRAGNASKYLDDAFDYPDDYSEGYNLILGLARDVGELPIFEESLQNMNRTFLHDLQIKRNTIKKANVTRYLYRQKFNDEINQAPKKSTRLATQALSNLLF